jgi:Tol biopolymer transport system component
VYDVDRATLSRLTFDPGFEGNPVWTADGTRIVYASEQGPGLQLFWKRWDDPREETAFVAGSYARVPHAATVDGRYLTFTENHPKTRRDIWILPMDGGAPEALLASPFEENSPAISRDGKLLAYHSNESGRDEIYVRSFSGSARRIQISDTGGAMPRWAEGGELFYRRGATLSSVRIQEGPAGPEAGPIRTVLEGDYVSYDVTPDGKKFLMIQGSPPRPMQLIFVQGWEVSPKR